MADAADLAQSHMELEEPLRRSVRKRVTHTPNGLCHNCDEPIVFGLYCNQECREDFEKREARGLE